MASLCTVPDDVLAIILQSLPAKMLSLLRLTSKQIKAQVVYHAKLASIPFFGYNSMMDYALQCGSLSILLMTNPESLSHKKAEIAMRTAASEGHFNLVKWFVSNMVIF
jgi:hypothetical protein